MAAPVVAATAESSVNTAGTSHAVTLPGGGAATDEYLILMDIGSTAATLNALTDWTELLDENVANGLKILVYDGAGVPSDPTFTSSAATRSASIAFRITGADKSISPGIGTTATGTSATPDPPSVTPPSSKDYLFIAFFGSAGEEVDDDTWSDTPPTNYTPSPPLQKACGTAGSSLGGMIAAASRQLTTGSAEDPGTFAQDVSRAWRAQAVIVHPAPPALASTVGGPSRDFDGTDDFITLATGGLADLDGGPITIAAVVRLDAVGGAVLWAGSTNASADRRWGLEMTNPAEYETSSGNSRTLFSVSVAENWMLVAVTKADGTTTPRGHKYVYDTATWTHADAAGTLVDAGSGPGSGGVVQIGQSATGIGGFVNGKVAAVGVWKGVLPDSQIEALAYSLARWRNFGPAALWLLDQLHDGVPLQDLAGGGANQTAIVGTAAAWDRPAAFSTLPAPAPALPRVAPAAGGDAVVTPAVIAATVALPQPAVAVGAAPAALAAAAALPQPGVGVGAAPAAVAAAVALPAAALSVGAAPAAIAAAAALPQPTVGVGVAPAVLVAVAALPQPAVGVGVAPAAVPVVVALPPPTSVGQVGDATVAPAVLAAVVALPQPGVGVGAAPAVIPVVALVGTGIGVDVGAAPAVIPAVVALPLPTSVGEAGGSVTVTPAAIAAAAAMPKANIAVGAAPAVLPAVAALPQPGVGVGVAPAVIPLLVALPAPQVFSSALVTPAAVALVVAVPKANIGVGAAPAAIVVLVALPLPDRVGPPAEENINPPGPTMVGLVVVEQDTVLGATTRRGGMVGDIG